jgi:hypothetical protein
MSIQILWARLDRGVQICGRTIGVHGPIRCGQEGVARIELLACGALRVIPESAELGTGVILPASGWRELGPCSVVIDGAVQESEATTPPAANSPPADAESVYAQHPVHPANKRGGPKAKKR